MLGRIFNPAILVAIVSMAPGLYAVEYTAIRPGQSFGVNEEIYAPGKEYMLVVQGDGNLVFYHITGPDSRACKWHAFTNEASPPKAPGNSLVMFDNGFGIRRPDGTFKSEVRDKRWTRATLLLGSDGSLTMNGFVAGKFYNQASGYRPDELWVGTKP